MDIPWVSSNGDCSAKCADAMLLNWAEAVRRFNPPIYDSDLLDEASNVSMLAIDDIGAENDHLGIGLANLYLLLERGENKWMMVTTNITADKWEDIFKRRITSRLLRNFTRIDLDSVPDYKTLDVGYAI